MKQIKFISLSSVLIIAAMFVSYFLNQRYFLLPMSQIGLSATAIIALIISYHLRKTKNEDASVQSQINDFKLFYFTFGIFLAILGSSGLAAYSRSETYSFIWGWAHRIGHIFFFTSAAYFIKVPLAWFNPKLKNWGFAFFVVLGAITTILNIINPISARLDSSGINVREINPIVAVLIMSVGIMWIPVAFYYIYQALKKQERHLRMKALLMGVGIFIMVLGGPTHGFGKTVVMSLAADILILSGITVMSWGIFYPLEKQKAEELNNQEKS